MYSNGRSEEVTVEREHMGGVIGRGGASIKGIQEKSGATIETIAARRGTKPSLMIRGTRSQIEHARALVHEKVGSLVDSEMRRQLWRLANPYVPKHADAGAKNLPETAKPVTNMFAALEIEPTKAPKTRKTRVVGLPDTSAEVRSGPITMTLDEYMAQQPKKLDHKIRKLNGVGDKNYAQNVLQREEMAPIVARGRKRAASESESPVAPKQKKAKTKGLTFKLGEKPKIGKLKYQNYLHVKERKERQEAITLANVKAEERTVVSPSGRPLSADAEEFTPAKLASGAVSESGASDSVAGDSSASPEPRKKRKGSRQRAKERRRAARLFGVETPPPVAEDEQDAVTTKYCLHEDCLVSTELHLDLEQHMVTAHPISEDEDVSGEP